MTSITQAIEQLETHEYGRELSNLAKLYTDENKYSGENDNFDYKFNVFIDLCGRAGVSRQAIDKAFPTMLKGLALDYFYSNCKNCQTAEQYADSIRSYFEGEEHKRALLRQWNSLTLSTIMERSSNESKTTEESLQLLIKELRHIQHGLDWEFRTENSFHNKLIIACQEVPACKFACYKPSPTVAGLINDLRSSIVTHEKVKPAQTFFTDRRFHNPRPHQRGNNRFTVGGNRYRKKGCFVCNKEGCWSSNHTPEERERAKTRYKERISKRVDQYITEWNEEPDLDLELEEDMEVLLTEEGPVDDQDQFGIG
jgi:hypothetical protein